jgi:hypothetical protein
MAWKRRYGCFGTADPTFEGVSGRTYLEEFYYRDNKDNTYGRVWR